MQALKGDELYTYEDYLTWDGDTRYELIEGVPYMMSPAPSRDHQKVSGNMYITIGNFLKGKTYEVYSAPFDVRLEDDTVVQPDLVVVCDKSKLDNKGCNGAPDLVVEILSPSTARHDKLTKFRLYQGCGVREYWLVDIETKTVQVCILDGGKYITTMYGDSDDIPVHVLEGCLVNTSEVFDE